MKKPLDRSKFKSVKRASCPELRAEEYLSYIEDQIRHDTLGEFHEDIFLLPVTARRLYLALTFNIGVEGDGFPGVFSFYGAEDNSLINEIREGYKLVGMEEVDQLIERSYNYWINAKSGVHSAEVPWMKMDDDLDGVLGRYFTITEDIFEVMGRLIKKLGEAVIHDETKPWWQFR